MFFIFVFSAGNSLSWKFTFVPYMFEKQDNYYKIRLIFKIIIFLQMWCVSYFKFNQFNYFDFTACLVTMGLNYQCWVRLGSLCCNGQQMAGRNSSLAICTCICTPFVDSHSSSTNPRIPSVASVTSRRIATYRATPLRIPFRFYSHWRRAFSLALEPALALTWEIMQWMTIIIYIDHLSNSFNSFSNFYHITLYW